MGNKVPLQSEVKGVDTVTGLPATTGGPYASPNPVKPFGHPAAIEAQRRNKTGSFADATAKINTMRNKNAPATLEDLKNQERARADAKAAEVNAAREKSVGAKAAAEAPVKTPASIPVTSPTTKIPAQPVKPSGVPSITSKHIPTATVTAPAGTNPMEPADETGNTSKDGEATPKG